MNTNNLEDANFTDTIEDKKQYINDRINAIEDENVVDYFLTFITLALDKWT